MSGIVFSGVFAGYASREVLHGIDATVASGEWLALIGPNGAGKSTLLKAAAGLVPASGNVSVDGVAINTMSRRRLAQTVAYVPQIPVIPAGTTVFEYVLLGRNPHIGYWRSEARDDIGVAAAEIDRLDLGMLSDRPIESLSGGERQRAVLARALAQRPAVLLLDEPTTGLDLGHQQQFLESVDELRAGLGISVIAAVHDLTLAAIYADRLMMLADGRIVAAGQADDVLTPDRVRRFYAADVTMLRDDAGHPVVVPQRSRPQPTIPSTSEPTR